MVKLCLISLQFGASGSSCSLFTKYIIYTYVVICMLHTVCMYIYIALQGSAWYPNVKRPVRGMENSVLARRFQT